jgi:hypothetical protein
VVSGIANPAPETSRNNSTGEPPRKTEANAMAQVMPDWPQEKASTAVRVPEWIYYFSDEQFVQWCRQRKLDLCASLRTFPDDERAAIFRYMVRQSLAN